MLFLYEFKYKWRCSMDTYKINNLNSLEESAAVLGNNGADLEKNAESIKWILSQIKANWENPDGLDIVSVEKSLNECITKLNDTIIPLVREYAETLNTLVAATREIQKREMNATTM